MKIAVTGASGYVGGTILTECKFRGHDVLPWSRRPCEGAWTRFDLKSDPGRLPWESVDVLIHTAYDFQATDWTETCEKNVKPSIALLRAGHEAGVKRMVMISSISSFEGTVSNYGKAKLEIEKSALELGAAVVRPGLVWGDQPGGVMGALQKLVESVPVIPCLSGPGGLAQYLVHETDLAKEVVSIGEHLPMGGGLIHEATHPDPVPLKSILKIIAARSRKSRVFFPVPWQAAMLGLKLAEWLGLTLPFRSDSLRGLVHRVPGLRHEELQDKPKYRSFLSS